MDGSRTPSARWPCPFAIRLTKTASIIASTVCVAVTISAKLKRVDEGVDEQRIAEQRDIVREADKVGGENRS